MGLRWGILGCGSIAGQFARGLAHAPRATLAAVGSRSLEKAEKFRTEHGAGRAFGSYEELAASGEVDAIYVATPHPMHCDDTLLCLNHGKAVLCEKPFAINASEARKMVEAARNNQVLLMEAMWTRCFPIMVRLREELAAGRIGDVRFVSADFGFRAGFDPKSRLFDPALGGGALLDVGVYAISFASMVLGKPTAVAGLMQPAPTGVDAQSAFVLAYPNGAMASLFTSVESMTPWEATVLGTEGKIRVQSPFWKPSRMTITVGDTEEIVDLPYEGNGYQFEAMEVESCMSQGLLESPVMPHDETISIMETMDSLRSQWGLRYPSE
ncbi:MAG TPA: Gfo/Idh/MocA family oxidoreductase [Fimbriimonadaceae bacterium]|nr:Gfo/Idh/MocA family oxidoreductase [Fimbriimonadaceae bacterium]